jgi:hypothetical protein
VVSFNIENISAIPVREIYLYRKRDDQRYKPLKAIPVSSLQNGGYTYVEEYVDAGDYAYYAAVFTEDHRISGKSNEGLVKIE